MKGNFQEQQNTIEVFINRLLQIETLNVVRERDYFFKFCKSVKFCVSTAS